MRHKYYFIFAVLMLTFASSGALTQGLDGHDGHEGLDEARESHDTGDDDEEGDGLVRISPETAQQAGLSVDQAGPATLDRTLRAYGKVIVPPGQESQVKARFPGQIIQVHVQIGDTVQAGDLLAEIESNDSLRTYQLRAPINGVVTDRQAATGDIAQDQVLFSIANLNTLWVELRIFPGQRSAVAQGQTVLLSSDGVDGTTTLSHVLPSSGAQPYVTARGALDNRNGQWAPGLLVMGQIVVESFEAPLAVDSRALQTVEGKTVVFVEEDNAFKAQPVELGRSDDRYTEILSGLETGDRYVVDNSFLVKADLLKSSVEDHD